jgi:hypothetical protein
MSSSSTSKSVQGGRRLPIGAWIKFICYALILALLPGCNPTCQGDGGDQTFLSTFVFVANADSKNINVFEYTAAQQSLRSHDTFAATGTPVDLKTMRTSTNEYLFVASTQPNVIIQYQIFSGTATPFSRVIYLPATPKKLRTQGDKLYAILSDNRVLVYHMRTGDQGVTLLGSVENQSEVTDVVPGFGEFWILRQGQSTVARYNVGATVTPANPPTMNAVANPFVGAVSRFGYHVVNHTGETVQTWPTGSSTATTSTSTGTPLAVKGERVSSESPGTGFFVLTANPWEIKVYVFEILTGVIGPGTVSVPADTRDFAYELGRFFVVSGDNKLRVYADSLQSTANTGQNPVAVATTEPASGNFLSEPSIAGSLPAGTVGTPYSGWIALSGTPLNVAYPMTLTGNLPPGLQLVPGENPNHRLVQGTPTTAGTFNFSVEFDLNGSSVKENFSITISGGQTQTNRWVRVANLAFHQSNNPLDFFLSGLHIGNDIPFGQITPYQQTEAQGQAQFFVRKQGGQDVANIMVTISPDTRHTFIALGNAATTVGIGRVERPANYTPPTGHATLWLMHGLSNVANDIDFIIVPRGAPIDHENRIVVQPFGYQGTEQVDLPAGQYDLIASPRDANFQMFRTEINLAAGNLRIAIAQSPTNQPGSFVIFND